MEKKKIHKTKILYASFNKDKSCLSLGMQTGYRIYDLTQDLSKKNNLSFYERILGKAISIIEMLEKTSFLALSGVDDDPHLSSKHVKIYDDREGKVITEIKFKTKVIHLRLKKDRMLVVCEKSIYIIGFPNFSSIDSINLVEEKRKKIAFAFSLEQQVNKLAYNIINNNENVIKINSYDAENGKITIEMKSNLKPNNLIKFIIILDNSGKIIYSKYFTDKNTAEKQREFEKQLCIQVKNLNILPGELDVFTIEDYNVFVKLIGEVAYFIGINENDNECLGYNFCKIFENCLSNILNDNFERSKIFNKLEKIMLLIDEMVDNGIIVNTDQESIEKLIIHQEHQDMISDR